MVNEIIAAIRKSYRPALAWAMPRIAEIVRENIRAGRDPNGKRWARRKDGERALTSLSDRVRVLGNRVSVGSPAEYHQAKRPILPEESAPKAWENAIELELEKAIRNELRGHHFQNQR